jgi:hypothetical protein
MQIRHFAGTKGILGGWTLDRDPKCALETQIRIRAVREIIRIPPDPDPHPYLLTGAVQGLEAYECLSHDGQGLGAPDEAFYLSIEVRE